MRYTGKEHDIETGLDYFGARYYASSMGRMMSPDWSAKIEPVPYSKLDDPQSLNLYSYVRNNPMSRIDADGHRVYPVPRFGCSEGEECNSSEASSPRYRREARPNKIMLLILMWLRLVLVRKSETSLILHTLQIPDLLAQGSV